MPRLDPVMKIVFPLSAAIYPPKERDGRSIPARSARRKQIGGRRTDIWPPDGAEKLSSEAGNSLRLQALLH
jgi:hypothetical protein